MHDKVIAEKNVSINRIISDKKYYGLRYVELIEKDNYYKVIIYNSYNVASLSEENAVGYGRLLYDLKTSYGRDFDTVQETSFRTYSEAISAYQSLLELDWISVAGDIKKELIKALTKQGIYDHTNKQLTAINTFNDYVRLSGIRKFNNFDEVDTIGEGKNKWVSM